MEQDICSFHWSDVLVQMHHSSGRIFKWRMLNAFDDDDDDDDWVLGGDGG